jgi:hypothetical protein
VVYLLLLAIPKSHASNLTVIWSEELKAALRGRFAWSGAGIVLLAIGAMATAGTQDAWLDGYGIVAYGLVPLAFIPLAAGLIASARASRFVECVFTAPVNRRDWFVAKVFVLLTLGAGYYVSLLPMMAVYAAHVGFPPLLHKFLIWTPALLVISIFIGALIGVLFIGRSLAAPSGAGIGVLLFYAGLIPLQELMVARGNGASGTGHLTLASPAVLMKNALGFALAVGNIPSTTLATWISLLTVAGGSLALAFWIFLDTQGIETWEATRRQRWSIALGLAVITLFPIIFADTDYDSPAPASNRAPVIRGVGRGPINLALVAPGRDIPTRCCSPLLNRESGPVGTDEKTARDLLILFPLESTDRISVVEVLVSGENGLSVSKMRSDDSRAGERMEQRKYPNDSGPLAVDGHHITKGWVARVPLTLLPTKPWDVGGNRYSINVHAVYRVNDEPVPRTFTARALVEAQIPGVIYEMAGAALLFPTLCFGAAFRRWKRTR